MRKFFHKFDLIAKSVRLSAYDGGQLIRYGNRAGKRASSGLLGWRPGPALSR